MSVHLGWGSLLVALGQSFPSWRAEHSLSCWAAALPRQDSDPLAHRVTLSSVKTGLDYCVSPRSLCSLLQSFSASSGLSSTGKGQTPCQAASCVLFTLDIYTHFPVLAAVKTGHVARSGLWEDTYSLIFPFLLAAHPSVSVALGAHWTSVWACSIHWAGRNCPVGLWALATWLCFAAGRPWGWRWEGGILIWFSSVVFGACHSVQHGFALHFFSYKAVGDPTVHNCFLPPFPFLFSPLCNTQWGKGCRTSMFS